MKYALKNVVCSFYLGGYQKSNFVILFYYWYLNGYSSSSQCMTYDLLLQWVPAYIRGKTGLF